MGVNRRDERLPLFAPMMDFQNVTGIAARLVDAGDHQFIARPQKLDDRFQLNPVLAATPEIFSDRMISQPSAFELDDFYI